LNNRSRLSRQLEQWLTKIDALKPNVTSDESPRLVVADFADYVRALQRIALGHDPEATPKDKLAAVRELLKLEVRGTSAYIDGPSPDDPDLRRRMAEISRARLVRGLEADENRLTTTA
jgi:hypothetical protein